MSNIITRDIESYVEAGDGGPKTNSLKLAVRFGKTHKSVLKALKNIECSEDFNRRNFAPIEYIDDKGRRQPLVEMTRDGFMLLAMGFTGADALRTKEAFIAAFNKMEEELRRKRTPMLHEQLMALTVAGPAFNSLASVAKMFGLDDNQAALAANKAIKREAGIDYQGVLQIEMKTPGQERAFTPTELGARIGLSAQKFNVRLASIGFQEKRNDDWCTTEKGKPHALLIDAGKKHSDGTPIQQLKWKESVLEFLVSKTG